MPAVFTVPAVFKSVDKMSRTNEKMRKSFKRFSMSARADMQRTSMAFAKFNTKIKTVGRGITNAIGSIGVAIGALAIVAFVGDSTIKLESSLASLSAITGITGEAFKDFEKEIDKVSKSEKIFAADTAKAFELVGSAKPELLSSAKALGQVSKSAITLSKASGDELADNVAALTNVLNQFGLEADQSARAMNVLAAASVVGDTKITQTSQAFKVSGAEAKMSGLNIEQLSGTIALFSKFGFKGAEAGTKFRNILSKMSQGEALPKEALVRLQKAGVNIDLISDKSVPYMARLKELGKISNDSAALTKMFGAENKGAAAILLNNLPLLEANIKGVTGTSAASDQAAIKTNTLANRWKELTASFQNAITSTNSENKALGQMKKVLVFVANNMSVILKVLGLLIAAYVAFRTIMLLTNAAILAYNIAMGISGAITGIATIAVGKSTAALVAYKIATALITAAQWLWSTSLKAITAAQWLLNTALLANPIGIVIIAIVALIAVVTIMIKKWDSWGAALAVGLGPLGMIISLIQSFRRNWTGISQAFKEDGIIAGLKKIGLTIFDSLLMPLHQVLKLIAKIPGMGDIASPLAEKLQDFRKNLGVNVSTNESGQRLDSQGNLINNAVTKKLAEDMIRNESNIAGANITNNQFSGNDVLLNNQNQQQPQQQNSIIDLYLNNRSKDTEVYTEGTGINVYKTGN